MKAGMGINGLREQGRHLLAYEREGPHSLAPGWL